MGWYIVWAFFKFLPWRTIYAFGRFRRSPEKILNGLIYERITIKTIKISKLQGSHMNFWERKSAIFVRALLHTRANQKAGKKDITTNGLDWPTFQLKSHDNSRA